MKETEIRTTKSPDFRTLAPNLIVVFRSFHNFICGLYTDSPEFRREIEKTEAGGIREVGEAKITSIERQLITNIILSPEHAKALVKTLQDQITKYEEEYGPIKEITTPKEES